MQHNNKHTNFTTQPSLTHDSTNTTRHITFYRTNIKGHLAYTYDDQSTYFRPESTETILQRKIKARRVKILEFKEYNSKIVSADKAWREEDPKLDQFHLGFRPTVDIALIPLCNTPVYKKDINRAIIYVPGSSHTYIQQNEQYITAHITNKI